MDETQQLLRAMISRLDEMGAELKGLRSEVTGLRTEVTGLRSEATGLRSEVTDLRSEVKEFRGDTNVRLEKIEERLDYLAAKWMEHDEEIHRIRRRQA